MNIALLGFDIEGKASYEYFRASGNTVTVCDQNADLQLPKGMASQLGPDYLEDLDRFDLLVRTPGLKPSLILDKNPSVANKITSATNEFMRVCPTRNIIGVTGTKGKGTTSTLIHNILAAAGKRVFLGGNIGIPPLGFLPEVTEDSWVVLELSSFQLTDIQYSPRIGVCLMVVPEHLNWHADFEDYVRAKSQLFVRQDSADLMVYNADNHTSIDIARGSKAAKLWYSVASDDRQSLRTDGDTARGVYVQDDRIFAGSTEICRSDEVALLGKHNLQNICAAVAVTWDAVDHNLEAVRSVITTFRGLEHRLEFVRTLDGVAYYDDSFGTTPETAIVAIQTFDAPKIIILGGSDKGANYADLAKAVSSGNVKHALLIGDTAPAIKQALLAEGFDTFTEGLQTMPDVVEAARQLADAGDVVLLSTGCASFGMFANYKDRGAQFQQAVRNLAPL